MNINMDYPLRVEWGWFLLNDTLLFTWLVMAVLVIGSWLVTRNLSKTLPISRGQNLLEVLVEGMEGQIRDVTRQDPRPFLPFIGTLFLFIAMSNLLSVIPLFLSPAGALSTTAALAVCVFIAVPVFGISSQGVGDYLKQYLRPSPLMLPFNIIGELSRTLALAVRLYGNVMSGAVIGTILLTLAPLFAPLPMQLLGLLTGMIQAYIFAILAMVYIAAVTQARKPAAASSKSSTRQTTTAGDHTRG